MSLQSAEYESDMDEAIGILNSWVEWSPELEKAIKTIEKTMWWRK